MSLDSQYFEEKTLDKSQDLFLLARLFPFIRPYLPQLGIGAALVILITLLEVAAPYITKEALDRYIVPQISSGEMSAASPVSAHVAPPLTEALQGLEAMTGLFLAIIFTQFCLDFLQMMLLERCGQRIMHDLRMTLFSHLQTLEMDYFSRNPVGRLVTRVTNDIQNMNEFFTSILIFVFKDLFLILGIGAVLLFMNWKLALVCMAIGPFVILAISFFSLKAREVFRTLRVKAAQINTRFSETVEGLDVIQLFGWEPDNQHRFEKTNHENYEAGLQQVRVYAIFMPIIEILAAVSLATVIFFGGREVIAHSLTLGELTAFISYTKMFFRPIRDVAEKYNILQDALSSAERLFLILHHPSSPGHRSGPPSADGIPVNERISTIAFDAVSFSYPQSGRVLHNIHFEIQAGETVSVVGPTGSGKTSLIQLLVRFYEPETGRILINGRPLPEWDMRLVRRKMALVTQDPFLFSGSIADNIRHGGEDGCTPEILQAAIEGACLAEWVRSLPQGLDSPITEGGKNLSSGQRQLISIARAFARQPELIILDEATSYVDAESEQVVQKAMENLLANRTAIVIAHRLETARSANRILVMKNGRIAESGTHEELILLRGFYYDLYRLESRSLDLGRNEMHTRSGRV